MLEEKCSSPTQAAVVTGKQVLFPGWGGAGPPSQGCGSALREPRGLYEDTWYRVGLAHSVGLVNIGGGAEGTLELQVPVYRSHPGPSVSLPCPECHGLI